LAIREGHLRLAGLGLDHVAQLRGEASQLASLDWNRQPHFARGLVRSDAPVRGPTEYKVEGEVTGAAILANSELSVAEVPLTAVETSLARSRRDSVQSVREVPKLFPSNVGPRRSTPLLIRHGDLQFKQIGVAPHDSGAQVVLGHVLDVDDSWAI
jgi:hypothetical protein